MPNPSNPDPHAELASVGGLLRQARRESGLTVRALSATTGAPLAVISRILNDQYDVLPVPAAVALAYELNVPIRDILALAGIPLPKGSEAIKEILRKDYELSEDQVTQVMEYVDVIARKANQER